MHNRLLRPLLIVEFLIAIQVIFTLWSQVGGQYHLDLMFWPWKLGFGLGAAGVVVAITANIIHNDGAITRRALLLCSLLIAMLGIAGVVTYYYHLNEPVQQQDDADDEPAKISRLNNAAEAAATISLLPGGAGFAASDHGQAFITAERFLKFGHIRDSPIHPEAVDRVGIGLGL